MENKKLVFDGLPQLPQEIIFFEIFARLPVKSLCRFRCVSKVCRSLTSNPRFLDAVQLHSPRRLYAVSFTSASGNPCIFHLSTDEGFQEFHDRILDYYRQNKMIDYYRNRTYIKYINGFTCLAVERETVVRNFATGEEFRLPRYEDYHLHQNTHFAYFCYDPATDKYKVLRTTSVMNVRLDAIDMKFSIFTLGVDKTWRDFHETAICQKDDSKSANVCVNGILFGTNFFTSRKYSTLKENEDGVIAAFDVGRERFDIVAYPDGLSSSRYSRCDLTEVKGSIAVVDVEEDVGNRMMILWIKGEGIVSESWIEHRIQLPSSPLGNISMKSFYFSFTTNQNGEIVMGMAKKSTPRCCVHCYNMETGIWRRIGEVVTQGHVIYYGFVIDEYVETPLLLREILDK